MYTYVFKSLKDFCRAYLLYNSYLDHFKDDGFNMYEFMDLMDLEFIHYEFFGINKEEVNNILADKPFYMLIEYETDIIKFSIENCQTT